MEIHLVYKVNSLFFNFFYIISIYNIKEIIINILFNNYNSSFNFEYYFQLFCKFENDLFLNLNF